MKKTIILLVFWCMGVVISVCRAVSAFPGLIDYRQPDGSVITIRMMGDEYLHWAETGDGYTLISDSKGYMTLAVRDDNGDLKASEFRILPGVQKNKKFAMAKSMMQPHALFSKTQIEQAYTKSRMAKMRSLARVRKSSAVGTRKFLVILMQTPDVQFQKTRNDYNRLLNEVGYKEEGNAGSVHDFYDENSFGQLNLQCDVTNVYTASQNMAYYGNNSNGDPYSLAIEALKAAANDYNLNDYDTDGDGYLDGVHIVFAGHGEEAGGGDDCIWSHQATTSGYFCVADGVKMNKYSCSPELRGSSGTGMSYIGVICHEIGHVLGTMDFYDTNYSTGGQYQGTGQWDLMASGNWNGNGATPAHFNPYSKIYDFGWSDVQDGNVASMKTLHAKTKGDFVRIDTQTDGEFFLLEYRNQSGFDAALPGHGLMVYRSSDGMSRMSVNTMNAYHQQQFYPLCANATSAIPTGASSTYGTVNAASAPFPGSYGKTQLTDATTPSMKDWEGHDTGFPVTDITELDNSVSFCIAGGDGLAYGLKVSDATATSVTLAWNNDAGAEVLLVFNTENTFGMPGTNSYSVGQTVSGGGTVLYNGSATTYTHSDLNGSQYYYYRLYTKTSSGVWSGERSLTVKTPSGVITAFPYFEDFSTGVLDESWVQEYVSGQNDWTIGKLFDTTDYTLNFDWTSGNGQRQGTRAILPTINFSGHENACLEFDYRNLLIGMDVVYRTSPSDGWQLLKTLDNHFLSHQMTKQQAIDAETHVIIPLPNLSSTYQIAFVSDFYWRGNTKSSLEVGTIDDVKISVDYNLAVITEKATSVSNTWAEVVVEVYSGKQTITSYGVEWSLNQSSWTKVPASAGESIVHLSSLSKGTKIYYRAYATSSAGTSFGETKYFTTLSFTSGTGTEEDPFILSSSSDWTTLSKTTNTAGLYFALGSSISMTPSMITNQFDGHLDGCNYTITISANSGASLFENVGKDAVIANLNVVCNTFSTSGSWSSLLCLYNYGLIDHCDFKIETLKLVGTRNFAGATVKNFGTISNCHSYINMPLANIYNYGKTGSFCNQAIVGGLCWYNSNIIDHCSFDGYMASNNNSKLGGITAINWYEDDQTRGVITNCINRGTLEMKKIDSKSNAISIGGIAGSSYGDIRYCVNEGTITAECGNGDCFAGGILGWNSRTMSYCINRGNLILSSTDVSAGGGGIVGFNDGVGGTEELSHCISLGDITTSGSITSCFKAIAGCHRDDHMHDCYYSGSMADSYATKVTDWSNVISQINQSAGYECMKLSGSKPIMAWEQGADMIYLVLQEITDFTSTTISGVYTTSLGLSECGLLYKTADSDVWTKIKSDVTSARHSFKLDGLSPLTQYMLKAYVISGDGSTIESDVTTIMTDFENSGTAEDPYLISSVNEFKNFAIITQQGKSMSGCVVRLTQNLDMKASEGEVWTDFVDGFSGEFDGGGHYIYNMKYVSNDNHYGEGLFTDGSAYIHDLHLYDVEMNITRDSEVFLVGTIVGQCSKIERCSFVGRMNFKYGLTSWNVNCSAGGIAGYASDVRDCYALISVNSNWTWGFGGVVGRGNAHSSYTGILSTDNVISKLEGIQGNQYYTTFSVDSCYFLSSMMVTNFINGTPLTLTQMKDGTLLDSLTSGVWAADINGTKLDGGYPVLASQKALPVTQEQPEDPDDSEVIAFKDAAVKNICVNNWDTNKDGELSYDEAAAVTSVGTVFRYNKTITSFDELQYFTKITSIESTAFKGCSQMVSIVIPESVKTINFQGFADCLCLSSVTLPNSLNKIDSGAFCGCWELAEINFPKSMTTLGGAAFQATKLTSVYIPASVTSVGASIFSNTAITSLVVDENNNIYDSRDNCNAIIETASNMLVAGSVNTTIPNSVTSLGIHAFHDYKTMKEITIPSSVTSIGSNAFYCCESLRDMYVGWSSPITVSSNVFPSTPLSSVTLHVPAGTSSLYKNMAVWKDFGTIVEYGNVSATSISVDRSSVSVEQGKSLTLVATVLPDNATNKTVTWTSSNSSVATVTTDGVVNAISAGTATITATTTDGTNLSASCIVTVTQPDEPDEPTIPDSDPADFSNVVYLEPVTGYSGGQLTLSVRMKNVVEAAGYQCDLYLPDGVTFAKDVDGFVLASLSTARTTTKKTDYFNAVIQSDGALRLLCSSSSHYAFNGTDGEVALVTINIADTLSEGSYPIYIKAIEVSGLDSKSYKEELFKTTLSVEDYILGDANRDNSVTVSDFTATANYILGFNPSVFNAKAADVNTDQSISVSDLTGIANIILFGSPTGASNANVAPESVEGATGQPILRMSIPGTCISRGGEVQLPVNIQNIGTGFSAYQFDLVLPEGVIMSDMLLSQDRTTSRATDYVTWSRLSDGSYRILCASTTGRQFTGTDGTVGLLVLKATEESLEGVYDIILRNIELGRDSHAYHLDDASGIIRVATTTGIADVNADDDADLNLYNTAGQKVGTDFRGIIIKDNKKLLKIR